MKKKSRIISFTMTIALILSLGCTSFSTLFELKAYATAIPPDCIVYYELEGGHLESGNQIESAMYGDTYTMPTVSREGYELSGWWTERCGGGLKIEQGAIVEAMGELYLYANWTPNTYTVTFDPQGGQVTPTTKTYIIGEKFAELPISTRPGHEFLGWYTGSGGSGSKIEQDTVVNEIDILDNTLYAHWDTSFYTVTFDSQDGKEIKTIVSIRFGGTYFFPENTTRQGYTFAGWYLRPNDDGERITENTQVTTAADHTLYAKWIPDTYIINFDFQGGTPISGDETKEVTYGTTYGTLPEAERETYIFGGWRTEPEGAGIEVTNTTQFTITDNQTLYANWTRPKFTVTFDAQGGTGGFHTWSYTYGETYDIIGIPNYPGYIFNGWYTALNGGTYVDIYTIMSTPSDHTLYAKWTPKTYTVTLDPQGGEPTPSTLSRQYDSAYGPLPTPTRTNYTFAGWYTASGNSGTLVTADTTVSTPYHHMLYAKWTGNTYTVTLDPQGGEVTPTTQYRQFNSPYGDLPTPMRHDYIFEGWYTASDDSGTLVTAETTVSTTNDHALYAKWSPGKSITVTLDPQGGEVSRTTHYCNLGVQYGTLPEPTRTGYSLFGWCTTLGVSSTYIRATDIVSIPNDHTLYAFWVRDVYTVTFDAQYGAFVYENSRPHYVSYGGTYRSLPSVQRDNYTFGGWWTEPGGRGTMVTSDTPVTITADQTLYAKWNHTPPGFFMHFDPSPPPPPMITPGFSEYSGYIMPPPPPPPPPELPPFIVGRMTFPDSTQRILPGSYLPETGQFNFLYDNLPEDITGDSSFTMDYDLAPPTGISESHWVYQDALRLLSQGILDDEPIIPSAAMTRGDLIEMLYRAVAFPLMPTNNPGFSDTTNNDTAINWAAERGIINGFPDGTVRPSAEISRQETFVIIARFLEAYKIKFPDADTDSMLDAFSDKGDIDDWARDDIGTFVRYGIVRGAPGDIGPAINPLRDVTQAEMIALISRMTGICYYNSED